MRFVIDHEMFGDRAEFSSLAAAQTAIRACGYDFREVSLLQRGESIVDLSRSGIIVGYTIDTDPRTVRWYEWGDDRVTLCSYHAYGMKERLIDAEVVDGPECLAGLPCVDCEAEGKTP